MIIETYTFTAHDVYVRWYDEKIIAPWADVVHYWHGDSEVKTLAEEDSKNMYIEYMDNTYDIVSKYTEIIIVAMKEEDDIQ